MQKLGPLLSSQRSSLKTLVDRINLLINERLISRLLCIVKATDLILNPRLDRFPKLPN